MNRITRSTFILLGSIAALYRSHDASAATVIWRAQDFATGTNGNAITPTNSVVTDWTSTAGTSVESDADGGIGDPTFIAGATPGGTGVVSFSSDRMNGAAAENPVTGSNQFAIAIVFRATAAGVGGGAGSQWWQNSGIVDAEQAGNVNDWGTAMNSGGQLALGTGGNDVTGYTSAGYADSLFHTALFRFDGVTGNYDIFVDDAATDLSAVNKVDADPRNSATFGFGAIAIAANFFTGDLAEVRFFTGADSTNLNISGLFTDLQNTHLTTRSNRIWNGTVNGNWDTTSLNFTGSAYTDGDHATFGDLDGNGATVTRRTITIQAGGVTPASVTVNNSGGAYTFIGAIKNSSLFKSGIDSLTLGGAGDATDNTGLVAAVGAGTLLLAKDSSATVHAAASLSVGAGATARLAGTGGDQIGNSGAVTVNGTFDLNGRSETIGALEDAGITSGVVTNSAVAPSTFTIGSETATSTFSSTIQNGTGTVALVKAGAGTQVLGGNNSYTAGTTINAGVLRATSDQAYGIGSVTVNAGATAESSGGRAFSNNFILSGGTIATQPVFSDTYAGTLTVTASSTLNVPLNSSITFANTINGIGGLTKTGAGMLTFSVNSSTLYTGPITVSAGTIQTNAAGALGRGALIVNNGAVVLNDKNQGVGSLAGTGNISLGSATLSAGSDNTSTSFSGILSGTGGLTKTGVGTLTLGGTNTYTGATNINGGILRLESTSTATAAKANWSASTLTGASGSAVTQWTDPVSGISASSFNNSPTLGVGTLGGQNVVQFNGSQALQVLGTQSPIAALAEYSVALVFRTSANGVGGADNWWANTGLVDAEQPGATNDWGIAFNSSGQVAGGNGNPDQTLYSAGGLANGQGHVVIYSASSTDLTLNVDGVSTTVARTGLAARNASRILFGSMNAINYLTGDIAQVSMYDSALSGRRLNLVGAALANTYGLSNSAVYDTTVSALSDISPVVLNGAGATLDVNNLNEVIGSLAGGAGTAVTLGTGTLSVGNDNSNTTFAGAISGSGGIAKIGTGTLTLTGNNSYTGITNIRAGKLTLSSASPNNIGNSTRIIVPASTTLDVTGLSGGGITLGTQRLEGAGIVLGDVTAASGSSLFPGDNARIGTLTVGNLSLTSGSTLNYILGAPGSSTSSPGMGSLISVQGNLTFGNGLIFNPISNANANGQGVLGNGVYDLVSYTGNLAGFTGNNFQTPSIGTFTFTNQNKHIYVQISGLLSLAWTGATSATWDTSSSNWANGTTAATYQDSAQVILTDVNPITGAAITNSTITVRSGGVQPGAISFANNTVAYTLLSSDTIGIAGSTGITKTGGGTVTLQGANSFTGAVTINAGAVRAAHNAALGTSVGVSVSNGAALQLEGGVITSNAIPLTLNGTGLAANSAGALQNVSGANTYTGPVTLASNTTIGVTADVLILSGVISSGGRLTKSGSGTLSLNAANTYSGGTTIAGGVIKLGNGQALGANSSVITINSGAALDFNSQQITGRAYSVVISGAGTGADPTTGALFNSGSDQVEASFDSLTLGADASIGSNGSRFDIGRGSTTANAGANHALMKVGSNRVAILNPSSGFSSVVINGGTIQAEHDLAYGVNASGSPTPVTVNTGGTAAGAGGRTFANPFTLNGGRLQQDQGSSDTYTGTVTVSAASAINAGLNSEVIVNSLAGAGALTKTGPGTVTLSQNNSANYTGALDVSAGTLQAQAEGAVGRGALIVSGGTLMLNDNNQSVGSLTGGGGINLGAATLTTGSSNTSTRFSGSLSGTGALTKIGTGTFTLAGVNSYAGATTINGGTLRLEAAPPAPTADWSASTLTGGAGSLVTQWIDRISGVIASSFNNTPTLGAGTLGGQNVVQFNGTQALQILGAASPIANLSEYTVALVFRTSTNGVGGADNWWANTGLVDAEQPNAVNDWGIAFNGTGQVAGGNGNPDQTLYSSGGLADGQGHVVIFSASSTDLTLNVDGLSTTVARTGLAPRNVSRVLFGSMNAINYLTGDIAQVSMYNFAANGPRANLIGANLASTYGLSGTAVFDTSASDTIADTSRVALSGTGATLDLNGLNETIGSLSGGIGTAITLGAGRLSTGGDNTDISFAGAISGAGSVSKIGTGRWTLTGANTYTGATGVNGGSLVVNGSITGTANVNINADGTLAGTGTITTGSNGNIVLGAGAKLAPGDLTGKLTLTLGTGVLDLSAGVNAANSRSLIFTLGSVSSQLLETTGSLNIGNGVLAFDDFAFLAGPGFGEGAYTLFDTSSPIVGSLAASGLAGTINGLTATLASSANGQDIVLNVVPEPATAASLFAGAGVLLGLRRFRRRSSRLCEPR